MLLQIYYIRHIFDWPYNVSGYRKKKRCKYRPDFTPFAQNDKLV